MKTGFVYIWRDKKHNRYYVGCHWGNVDDGYICSSNRMRNSFRRRPEDFKRRILQSNIIDRKTMFEVEKKWLKLAEKKKDRYYNLHFVTHHWASDENSRLSLVEKMRKTKKFHAANMTQEERNIHFGNNRRGKPKSLEEIQKIKDNHFSKSENYIPNRGMLGKKHSEETKQKMRLASKGKEKSPEHKKAISISKKGQKAWCKGKTWEEIFGPGKARYMRELRKTQPRPKRGKYKINEKTIL